MMTYALFRAQGYPIGSGCVESANKLVVESRMKGAGMHWAEEHVNPMLALRNIVCNDRWKTSWKHIRHHLMTLAQAKREDRSAQRLKLLYDRQNTIKDDVSVNSMNEELKDQMPLPVALPEPLIPTNRSG